ncbi:MAG: FtsX-like permease family protein [Candidatus Thorarchaeota archaeon]|nr:FtsX-like permease family protein [Candidatus Thorarchaeota archaeon]
MALNRHVNLANYALGNVLKYRARSMAIVALLMASSGLLCSVEIVREGVMTDVKASLDNGPDVIVQKLVAGRQVPLPDEWVAEIADVPGVRVSTPRVWGYVDVGGGMLMTIVGVNVTEYSSLVGVIGTEIVGDGRFLNDNATRELVIGQGIADLMRNAASPVQIGVGSRIALIAYDGGLLEFTVVGVFESSSTIYSYDMILTDISSARELFGMDNMSCTDVAVWVDYGTNVNSIALAIEGLQAEARVLTRDAIRSTSMATYGTRAGIVAIVWAVFLVSVVMLMFSTSSAGADEARREVGLLKALGFSTVDVLEIRMVEALVLGLLGGSLGISAAILFDYVLGAPLLAGYLLGWSTYLLNSGLPLAISAETCIEVYATTLVPVLVATVVPAWRNAITDPDQVLRGV